MRIDTIEVAKFFSGFEAFHAFFHGYLLMSGTLFSAFGIQVTPGLNTVGITMAGALSLGLSVYGWRGNRAP